MMQPKLRAAVRAAVEHERAKLGERITALAREVERVRSERDEWKHHYDAKWAEVERLRAENAELRRVNGEEWVRRAVTAKAEVERLRAGLRRIESMLAPGPGGVAPVRWHMAADALDRIRALLDGEA